MIQSLLFLNNSMLGMIPHLSGVIKHCLVQYILVNNNAAPASHNAARSTIIQPLLAALLSLLAIIQLPLAIMHSC